MSRPSRRSWLARFGRAALILVALLALASAGGVLLLRWIDPPISAFMVEAWMEAKASGNRDFRLQHRWMDLNRISPHLALAVVASEDQKFPEHRGFDVAAIEKAYALNKHHHKIRGGSTISQQTAKNLFLWSGRSYFRKALEAYFTVLAESFWPKKRILEIYLNFAEFGTGVYGAEAAAQKFFHKPASRLTGGDAALLAAVLPSPDKLLASAPTPYLEQRRLWILSQMRDLGGNELLEEIDASQSH